MRRLFNSIRTSGIRTALAAGFGLLALGQTAQAANPLEMNFWLSGPRYDGNVPPCEAVLDKIARRFAEKETKFWNSDLKIVGYDRVREIGFRPWASDTIPRRFCTAHASLNDGRIRQVNYSIIEDGGFAGYGGPYDPGIEFCVVGVDRNWAFSPACKAARP
jgi:hypothetical protein